ncbi:hypothetical protein D0T25_20820 [Duganella sp. BJB488]|nr:hypothetical protein D0T26_31855 [Duganella sp. BJB489]RFP18218.1 hypothetical protein D0T25_20820 [Duganella sp. BJB488]RFP38011.1 hypothetical protein D0T24_07290 [Duganella sp. BJB480]
MDELVLSGARWLVLSGVRLSCYQEYESTEKPVTARVPASLNLPNLKPLTFNKSALVRWTSTENGFEPCFQNRLPAGARP